MKYYAVSLYIQISVNVLILNYQRELYNWERSFNDKTTNILTVEYSEWKHAPVKTNFFRPPRK